MDWNRNPQIETELYDRLRAKYMTEKPLPHLTELIYCLTRSYNDRFNPIAITNKELIYFAVGFGLEEVILRDSSASLPQSEELDKVWLTPDYFILSSSGGELDLKSTRMYANPDGQPKMGWPDTWIEQFKGYAYKSNYDVIQSQDKLVGVLYSVGIIYLIPAELVCGTFTFTKQELIDNWEHITQRRDTYMDYIVKGEIPTPFKHNLDWECKNCRYKLRCDTLSMEWAKDTN